MRCTCEQARREARAEAFSEAALWCGKLGYTVGARYFVAMAETERADLKAPVHPPEPQYEWDPVLGWTIPNFAEIVTYTPVRPEAEPVRYTEVPPDDGITDCI